MVESKTGYKADLNFVTREHVTGKMRAFGTSFFVPDQRDAVLSNHRNSHHATVKESLMQDVQNTSGTLCGAMAKTVSGYTLTKRRSPVCPDTGKPKPTEGGRTHSAVGAFYRTW